MGNKTKVTLAFTQPFRGIGTTFKGSKVNIGVEENEVLPYDLLLMSLGSCLYSTFEDVIAKKKLTFEKMDISILGIKREETPTTLKSCNVVFSVSTIKENEAAFKKSLDLACKYCSIYNTLQHVAEMKTEVEFNY